MLEYVENFRSCQAKVYHCSSVTFRHGDYYEQTFHDVYLFRSYDSFVAAYCIDAKKVFLLPRFTYSRTTKSQVRKWLEAEFPGKKLHTFKDREIGTFYGVDDFTTELVDEFSYDHKPFARF